MCESVIPSPPVQPISASRSGIGGGGDDVARDDDERARAARAARPPTRSWRRRASPRATEPRGGVDAQRALAREPQRRRRLVDPHAELERDAPQPARELRRLDGGGDRVEHAGEVRAASRRGARPPRAPAARTRRPRAPRTRRRTPSQAPTCAGVVAVHRKPPRRKSASIPCSSQNAPIASIAGGRRAAQPDRLLGAAARDEARQLRPPRQHHAAVAARGAAAADVALEHDDVAGGVALLELDRRPQADEAAAEDRDVGARGALERRRGRRVAERLAQPQRTMRLPMRRDYRLRLGWTPCPTPPPPPAPPRRSSTASRAPTRPAAASSRPTPRNSSDVVAEVLLADAQGFEDACRVARAAQREWAAVPAPARGRVIAEVGRLFEANKEALARLVTREIGKPYPEALGEVQEIIDTCDFFLGEGRRLYGQTVPSEMPDKQLFTFRDAGRRRGDHHRGQLPRRGAVVVPRAGDPVRERGRVEAGRVRVGDRDGDDGDLPRGRRPGGRAEPRPRRRRADVRRARAGARRAARRQGRLHRLDAPSAPRSARCAGATCSRRASSWAARTRWS